MIAFDAGDEPAVTSIIEALYVAAGARHGTPQAVEWLTHAQRFEAGVDALPGPRPAAAPTRLRSVS